MCGTGLSRLSTTLFAGRLTFIVSNAVSVDSQFTDCLDEHGVLDEWTDHVVCGDGRGDHVHHNVSVLLGGPNNRLEEGWYVGTVNVVPTTLALRLHYILVRFFQHLVYHLK